MTADLCSPVSILPAMQRALRSLVGVPQNFVQHPASRGPSRTPKTEIPAPQYPIAITAPMHNHLPAAPFLSSSSPISQSEIGRQVSSSVEEPNSLCYQYPWASSMTRQHRGIGPTDVA